MYAKLWTLRFLKRSGMKSSNLLHIYETVIRPATEYCAVVYHPLIPAYLANRLESVQRQAWKIIFGWNTNLDRLVQKGKVETLEERRKKNSLKFALKYKDTERFRHWFPRVVNDRVVRETTRRTYYEKPCRTERTRNNPLQYMARLLNEEENK